MLFLSTQAPCTVALECCGGSHYWGRAIRALGHDVKLIPANYVNPFVKRQKNDANDAAAVAEATSRASMRFVAVKTPDTQAHAALYRTRALFVQQRTQTANAIRSHLLEFGIVCGRGFAALGKLRDALEDGTLKTLEPLPVALPATLAVLFDQVERLTTQIDDCEAKMRAITTTDPGGKTVSDRSGCRSDHRVRATGIRRRLGAVQERSRIRGLDRSDPKGIQHGRETTSGWYHQDGTTGSAVPARPRRHGAGATTAAAFQPTVPRRPGSARDQT